MNQKNYNHLIFYLIAALLVTSCGTMVDLEPEDISYIYDERSKICFAYAGTDDPPVGSLGLSAVNCDDVLHLLDEETRNKVQPGRGTLASLKRSVSPPSTPTSAPIVSPVPTPVPAPETEPVKKDFNAPLKARKKIKEEPKPPSDMECPSPAEYLEMTLGMSPSEAGTYIDIITKYLPQGMSIKVDRRKDITIYR